MGTQNPALTSHGALNCNLLLSIPPLVASYAAGFTRDVLCLWKKKNSLQGANRNLCPSLQCKDSFRMCSAVYIQNFLQRSPSCHLSPFGQVSLSPSSLTSPKPKLGNLLQVGNPSTPFQKCSGNTIILNVRHKHILIKCELLKSLFISFKQSSSHPN